MQIINLETWERAAHYHFFKRMDYPHYLICSNVDITHFIKKVKERNLPLYYSMIFVATYAINQVKEMKYRIHGDDVVLFDTIHPAYADMSESSELFKMVVVEMEDNVESFVRNAKNKSDAQTDYFVREDIEGRDDLIYISCIPQVSFTNISHTMSFNKEDSVPRLTWGKYFSDNEKTLMPFSVQAHHSFVDGIHMGKYYECLQNYLDAFE